MLRLFLFIYACLTFNFYAQKINIVVSNEGYKEERTLKIYKDSSYTFSKKLLPYQSIPKVETLNNYFILIYSLEGNIEFYSHTGELINKNEFYFSPAHNEQKLLFSKSKNRIAFLISENMKNMVFIFNPNGRKIDSVKIEHGIASGLVYSNDENSVAVSVYYWKDNLVNPSSYFIDLKSKNIKSISQKFEDGEFNTTGELFLGYTNKKSFLFNINETKLLWEKETPENKIYLDCKIINDNTFLTVATNPELINGSWYFPDFEIQRTEVNGKPNSIYKYNMPSKNISINEVDNRLILNIDGKDEKLIELK